MSYWAKETGAEIAAELDALLKRRPDLSAYKMGKAIRNKGNALDEIRATPRIKAVTVKKIRDFIACPEEARYIPRSEYKERAPGFGQRIAAGIRRASVRKAREHLATGQDIMSAPQAAVRLAGLAVLEQIKEEQRRTCPIEQAKIELRKQRYTPVCSMAVFGGDPALFRVGSRTNVTLDELLAIAARKAA